MKKTIWVLLIVLGSFIPAVAGSSVWVVQNASGPVAYLGGTCHLLRQSDHPLPPSFDKAYQNASILVFETDLGRVQSLEFQQEMMKRSVYTDGTTLDKVLSASTYAKLDAAFAKLGIPLAQLNSVKPFMAVLTLLAVEFQKIGVSNQAGVDLFFYNKGKADGKKVGGLESPETQIAFLTTMADGIEDRFVLHGLKDIERINQLIEELISTWRGGDESKLYQFFLKDMKNDFPKLYQKLLIDRNMNWMPGIEQYLKTPEKEFFLVGVAHLVGPKGIVAQLKNQGYTVNKVK